MVYVLLCDGFEDMEAVVPCDLLRRAGVPVSFVGVSGPVVTGSQGLKLVADCTLQNLCPEDGEMLVLPGGRRGVEALLESAPALELVKNAWAKGLWVAAICAAPVILARLGITNGHRVCCYPDAHWTEQLGDAHYVPDVAVVKDEKLITGASAGCATAFGIALVEALRGQEMASAVERALVIR